MANIRKHTIIDVLIQYKIGFLIIGLLGIVLAVFNNYKIIGLYYFITTGAFSIYAVRANYINTKIVLDYIIQNEYYFIDKYQFNTGLGYKIYLAIWIKKI